MGAIVDGVVGGAFALGGLIFLALLKTGRIKKFARSPAPAADASGSASDPAVRQYPAAHQYPNKLQYPAPIP